MSSQQKRVCVAGGSGFIGGRLTQIETDTDKDVDYTTSEIVEQVTDCLDKL